MYRLKSVKKYNIPGRGLVFVCESPVECERSWSAMKEAFGSVIDIDGKLYQPTAFEIQQPNYPVQIGEKIGIVGREIAEDKEIEFYYNEELKNPEPVYVPPPHYMTQSTASAPQPTITSGSVDLSHKPEEAKIEHEYNFENGNGTTWFTKIMRLLFMEETKEEEIEESK